MSKFVKVNRVNSEYRDGSFLLNIDNIVSISKENDNTYKIYTSTDFHCEHYRFVIDSASAQLIFREIDNTL